MSYIGGKKDGFPCSKWCLVIALNNKNSLTIKIANGNFGHLIPKNTKKMHLKLLFSPDGRSLASDGLETGFDGQYRTPWVAGHTLEEKKTGFLVQNSVWWSASMAGHIFFDVSSQNVFNMFLLELAFHDQLAATIEGTRCSQLRKQKGQQVLRLPMEPVK